ncbi:hypothetical protein BDW66DRAFT_149545 [Aspergillus desertorum]
MLSQVKRLLGPFPTRMDVKIHLCREPPICTAVDEISGHVILTTATQVDISAVSVWLSGVATSRLCSLRVIETHQIVDVREQLFPPTACASSFPSRSATAAAVKHIFAFSIRLPQATQCSKTTSTSPAYEQQISMSTSRKTHLLRKLPPLTGASSSPEEIKYVLEASVRRDGVIRGTKKASRYPDRDAKNQTEPECWLEASLGPLTYAATAKLLNGPFLFLDQPIPLAVELTSLDINTDAVPLGRASIPIPISLHDFQTMLVETTKVRARGIEESHTRFHIVQTMSNLRHPLIHSNGSGNGRRASVLCLRVDDTLWSRFSIPRLLTPSFETCNISRSYKLEIRLGIGFEENNVRIVEFQFPVYLVSVAKAPAGIERPAPDYYEKHAFAKELELGL